MQKRAYAISHNSQPVSLKNIYWVPRLSPQSRVVVEISAFYCHFKFSARIETSIPVAAVRDREYLASTLYFWRRHKIFRHCGNAFGFMGSRKVEERYSYQVIVNKSKVDYFVKSPQSIIS